ncbi:MAG: GNAT family N-acetyltransferase [Acidobacteriaceae bacterium]
MNIPVEDTTTIRKVESIEEMEACVSLQQLVWQFRDLDVIPRRMFAVAKAIGGQTFGAWDGDRLIGYALAIPGIREGRPYLHSHMLAVLPQYRNRGIGLRLKFAQREDALSRGINLIEWTFDPLQIKNAYLNIEKLGAIVRRYTPDFYGISTSPLHHSLPTDRLHAEWWLNSSRVRQRIAGGRLPEYDIKETITVTNISGETVAGFQDLALESLLRVRRQFQDAFKNGLAAVRFRAASGEDAHYLLALWDKDGETVSSAVVQERR